MPTIGFADFLRCVRQRNVYAYNLRLVDLAVTGLDEVCTNAKVLDVGAGRRLKHFKRQLAGVHRLIGIDVDRADLQANNDIHDPVLGDGARLPFSADAFECIVSVDVVEHLQHPAVFFGEVARCLKPGGTAIICTPNLLGYKNVITYLLPRSLLDLAWRVLRGRPGQPHRTYYRANTAGRLRQVAADAGLSLEQLSYLNEVSHFLYPHPTLAVLAYLYGRALELLRVPHLLNYIVCVLHKPVPAPPSLPLAALQPTQQVRAKAMLVADEAL